MTDNTMADLEVIQQHINRLGVAALAEKLRAQEAQLVETPQLPVRYVSYRALDPAPHSGSYRTATVRPAYTGNDTTVRRHWHLTGKQWAIIGAITAVTMLVIWMAIWIVEAVLSAVDAGVHAVSAALPGLLGIGALVILALLLLNRGGGGSRISGTFEGRIHR